MWYQKPQTSDYYFFHIKTWIISLGTMSGAEGTSETSIIFLLQIESIITNRKCLSERQEALVVQEERKKSTKELSFTARVSNWLSVIFCGQVIKTYSIKGSMFFSLYLSFYMFKLLLFCVIVYITPLTSYPYYVIKKWKVMPWKVYLSNDYYCYLFQL